MARLSIRLLGPFQVILDGEPVTGFVSNKARALLAYLAIEADCPHTRASLVGLLWPDYPEQAARRSLTNALSNVRHVIGDRQASPGFLRISRPAIQFNLESNSWIDVAAFEARLQAVEDSQQAELQATSQLEEAIDLYRGDFLEGFSTADSPAFEEWALLEREYLKRLVEEALDRLVQWYESRGHLERALPYARRQLELDPWREKALRQVMRLLALSGQRAAALKQFEDGREVLKAELDVEPDEETIQLYEQIKAGELQPPPPPPRPSRPAYVPSAPPDPRVLAEPGGLPPDSRLPFGRNALFTGRRQPLLALAHALRPPLPSAGEGSGTAGTLITQSIHGMGGIGKTQLAVEFAYRYGRYFHGVHWLSCAQPEAIAAQVALCGAAMGLQPWPQEQPEQVRFTLQAWRRDASRLVILDNLEDIDTASEWLPRLTGGGVRLLLTARRRDWPLELGLVPLELRVFSPGESLAYLRRYLPQARASDGELKALARRLGHLPLALRLAGRYLARLGRLTIPEYLARLKDVFADPAMKNWQAGLGELRGHDLDLAASFFRSWQQVTDRAAQRIFLLAGYCAPNQSIPCELLDMAAELDQEACDRALSLLAGLGLLNLDDPASGPAIHPLLAEFARALPALGAELVPSGAGAEEVGEEAFSPLPALVAALVLLSTQANETGLPARFVPLRPHLEAVAAAAEPVEPEGVATLWINLGHHRDIIADYAGARAACERALEIRKKVLPPGHSLFASTYNYLGIALHDLGDLDAARAAYERALAIAQAGFGPDNPNVARYLHSLGLVLRDQGDLGGARATFERALALFEKQPEPDRPNMAALVNNMGEVLRDLGDLNGARAACERALAIDQATFGPEHPKVARDVNSLGTVLQNLGDYNGARDAFERALAIDQATFGPDHHNVARDIHNLGTVLQALGDLDGAWAAFERALPLFEKLHGPEHGHVATVANNMGEVLRDLGDLDGAQAAFERALAIDQTALGPDHPRVARYVNSLGTVLQNLGDYSGARAAFERALAIDQAAFGPDHPHVGRDINNLGGILLTLGDHERARDAYHRALTIWQAVYGREHPASAQALWGLGTLATETGDVCRAREYLEEALAILQNSLPPHHPHVRELGAQLEALPPTLTGPH